MPVGSQKEQKWREDRTNPKKPTGRKKEKKKLVMKKES